MKLQDMTLQQLKEIVDGAPEGATHVIDYDDLGKYDYLKDPDTWVAWYGSHWNKPGLLIDLSDKTIIKLSNIRTRIAELEPVFKVGDRVVPKSEATNLIRAVREVLEVDGDQIRYHMEAQVRSYWSKAKGWRHATPEEIAAGHRIDEPQLDPQFIKDALGSTIYTQEYMNSLHPFDCEKCSRAWNGHRARSPRE